MRLQPAIENPELTGLLKRSAEIVAAQTPGQRAEMYLRQRLSWVRGEMGISNPDWSDEKLADLVDRLPEAWALAEIDRLRAAIKAQCHRLEHDYNAADVTEARRALMAAAAS